MFGLHKSAIFCHSYFIRAKLEPFCEGETFIFVFLFIYLFKQFHKGRQDSYPPLKEIPEKKMFNYLTRLSKIS